jgi:hypothetical protein
MPPASRNANMRYLRAAFNLGYLRQNPIARLDFQELPSAESFGGNPAFKAKREFPRPSPKRSRPNSGNEIYFTFVFNCIANENAF